MAKESAADAIMPGAKLKPLLALSKREPVNAAIGVTADGEGFILLDKKAKPRKVAAMVKASAAKAKLQLNPATIRYGRAEVDTELDASMVRFFINKEAPGTLRIKLLEVVKKISYQKIELNVDESIDAEGDEESENEGEDVEAAAGPVAEAAPEPPPPPAPPLAPTIDGAALKRALAGMMGRIAQAAGADPARKTQLVQLAGAANGALKGTDMEAAAAAIEALRTALDAAAAPATGAGADAFRAAFTAAWGEWIEAIDAVEAQIDILGRVLHASGDEGLQNIADSGLPSIFENHKVKLTGAGMRLRSASGAGLAKSIAETNGAIAAFSSYLASSPKVAVCDEVDVGVSVSIRATLGPALNRLSGALKQAPDLAKAA